MFLRKVRLINRPARAVAFQSMTRGASPLRYSRSRSTSAPAPTSMPFLAPAGVLPRASVPL
jgi:hypothetical protein